MSQSDAPRGPLGRDSLPTTSRLPLLRTPSNYSNEADDELSDSGLSDMRPTVGSNDEPASPRYEDEDCRPTSKKELLGFYAYSCAAEAVVIGAVSSFIPITLEQLARENGVLQSDRSTPCSAAHNPAVTPLNSSNAHVHSPGSGTAQCVVSLLGMEVNTASFAMYTFSLSVLLQALVVITMSGAADHGRYRKTLLLGFAFTGAVSTMLFLAVTSNVYALGALLAMITNVCLGASFVLLNAYLPLLVRWYPTATRRTSLPASDTVDLQDSGQDEHSEQNVELRRSISNDESELIDSTAHLLPASHEDSNPASPSISSAELRLSTKISSYGIGIGYLAALVVQVFAIIVVLATGSTTFSLRLVLFAIGAWWFLLTIPAAYCLRPRPGPPLAFGDSQRSWLGYVTYSWTNLGRTISRARRLKDVLLFLAAWFLISDAIATVSGTAILFAKTTLSMRPAALSLINVIGTTAGVLGAFTWSKISRIMGLTPSQTILYCIFLFEIIPLYGMLGFIPAIKRAGIFGLQQPWEMYPLGAVYGFVLGGLSSYCRSLFGELVPEGSEAAFYALYAVTDKGSSVFGPAIVGAITDATGEIRPAFIFLAVLIGMPIPLMMAIDIDRGRKAKVDMAKHVIPRYDTDRWTRPEGHAVHVHSDA